MAICYYYIPTYSKLRTRATKQNRTHFGGSWLNNNQTHFGDSWLNKNQTHFGDSWLKSDSLRWQAEDKYTTGKQHQYFTYQHIGWFTYTTQRDLPSSNASRIRHISWSRIPTTPDASPRPLDLNKKSRFKKSNDNQTTRPNSHKQISRTTVFCFTRHPVVWSAYTKNTHEYNRDPSPKYDWLLARPVQPHFVCEPHHQPG